jgi:hypothetical protein
MSMLSIAFPPKYHSIDMSNIFDFKHINTYWSDLILHRHNGIQRK